MLSKRENYLLFFFPLLCFLRLEGDIIASAKSTFTRYLLLHTACVLLTRLSLSLVPADIVLRLSFFLSFCFSVCTRNTRVISSVDVLRHRDARICRKIIGVNLRQRQTSVLFPRDLFLPFVINRAIFSQPEWINPRMNVAKDFE